MRASVIRSISPRRLRRSAPCCNIAPARPWRWWRCSSASSSGACARKKKCCRRRSPNMRITKCAPRGLFPGCTEAMKQAALVILLIAAGAWLADMHVAAQTYHPVVKVAAPEGLTYTVVQEPTGDRGACGAANDRFLGPFKALCKKCQVLYARCARELEGATLSMQDGNPISAPILHIQGQRS